MNRARIGIALGLVLAGLIPAVALAHPLGNFTINHYAGLRIQPGRVSLDLVIDEAEIPTFQERQRIDTNGDGTISSAEQEAERLAACPRLVDSIHVSVAGQSLALGLDAAGLAFLPGAGNLTTMRVVCELSARLDPPLAEPTTLHFEDDTFPERIGWREIVIAGDGAIVTGADLLAASPSGRLTHYPVDLLSRPLSMQAIDLTVQPGGPTLSQWTAPDAAPLQANAAATVASQPVDTAALGAIPGGVGTDLASVVTGGDLTPPLLVGSLLVALALGAAHALSPGHGKTIMAAYLVGTRGTIRQAVGLGLAVTVSHTLGVLALAAITLAATSTLPPERLYPILGVASGGVVVVIGARLLLRRLGELRRPSSDDHGHGHDYPHGHEHGQEHGHEHGREHGQERPHLHDGGHDHPHGHVHGHSRPAETSGVTWRSLFALGLSGGLVPSASALILLLGSIATGRVAYGIVLVVAFGLGMAIVLGGVGIALVHASRLAMALPGGGLMRRRWGVLQVGVAGLVVVLGIALTGQALTQVL
jgi:nickel/cobalt exporter